MSVLTDYKCNHAREKYWEPNLEESLGVAIGTVLHGSIGLQAFKVCAHVHG